MVSSKYKGGTGIFLRKFLTSLYGKEFIIFMIRGMGPNLLALSHSIPSNNPPVLFISPYILHITYISLYTFLYCSSTTPSYSLYTYLPLSLKGYCFLCAFISPYISPYIIPISSRITIFMLILSLLSRISISSLIKTSTFNFSTVGNCNNCFSKVVDPK